ncbi:MAG: hypothetical protein ACI81V_000117 [Lentimonas sp.]|jgi:hypothetical protein
MYACYVSGELKGSGRIVASFLPTVRARPA